MKARDIEAQVNRLCDVLLHDDSEHVIYNPDLFSVYVSVIKMHISINDNVITDDFHPRDTYFT